MSATNHIVNPSLAVGNKVEKRIDIKEEFQFL